jgi:hypothetical protein
MVEAAYFGDHTVSKTRPEAVMYLFLERGGVGAETDEESVVGSLFRGPRRYRLTGCCNDFQRAHQPSGIFGIDRFRAAGVLFPEEREKFPRR